MADQTFSSRPFVGSKSALSRRLIDARQKGTSEEIFGQQLRVTVNVGHDFTLKIRGIFGEIIATRLSGRIKGETTGSHLNFWQF